MGGVVDGDVGELEGGHYEGGLEDGALFGVSAGLFCSAFFWVLKFQCCCDADVGLIVSEKQDFTYSKVDGGSERRECLHRLEEPGYICCCERHIFLSVACDCCLERFVQFRAGMRKKDAFDEESADRKVRMYI